MENDSLSTPRLEWIGRAIMLLDLDAFFASVEQLDHPEWRGKPVIVGGDADKRGVVSTCSYEARAFGVHSAMPASTARTLCPDAIWTPGHFSRYREMSDKVMKIMGEMSPFLQQVSIDEAFMDVTPGTYTKDDPVFLARRVQAAVDELGISCSIGLGVSKAVAKVASDVDKPHGLTVVYPGREESFLAPLPCKAMSGIGAVAQRKLAQIGIHTLGQVAAADPILLRPVFGKNVEMMQQRCKGADVDQVAHEAEQGKSISNEISFVEDIVMKRDIDAALATICAKVARRLRKNQLFANSLACKVRYSDRSIKSAQMPLPCATDDEYVLFDGAQHLAASLLPDGTRVRLLGVAAFNLQEMADTVVEQQRLFDNDVSPDDDFLRTDRAAPSFPKNHQELIEAADSVRDKFGEGAVLFGRELRTHQNLTGSSSKNPADYRR